MLKLLFLYIRPSQEIAMIRDGTAQHNKVVILGDLENVFMPFIKRDDFPRFIRIFLPELIRQLLVAGIIPTPDYCRLYLEKQNQRSSYGTSWEEACRKSAAEYNFDLYWSAVGRPAEDLLDNHVDGLINDQTSSLETYVISGDGDLAETIDKLRRWKGLISTGTVCCLSWRHNYNRFLGLPANGIAFLEELVPETYKALQERHQELINEKKQIVTP